MGRAKKREGKKSEFWFFLPFLFSFFFLLLLLLLSRSPKTSPSKKKLTDRLGRRLPDVPKLYGFVRGTRHDLRVRALTEERAHRVGVPRQAGGLHPAAHVPDARGAVAPPRDQHVERRVQTHAEDAAEVAVVVADHLVRLQVPALDLLVQGAAEQVRVPGGDREARDLLDVAREGQAELARREVLGFGFATRWGFKRTDVSFFFPFDFFLIISSRDKGGKKRKKGKKGGGGACSLVLSPRS